MSIREIEDKLKEYMETEGDAISWDFAYFLCRNLGNVKVDGTICQYQFLEGDLMSDVKVFLKKYYPDLWKEF